MTVLATPRLRLVMPGPAHVAAHAAFVASARAEALGWQAMPHEAWRSFAALLGHHVLRGFGPLVAEARDDGRAVGVFGPSWPEGQPEFEIIWTVWSAGDEGKGLAHEAARVMLDYAFGTLGWQTAVSYIAFGNERSAALARRLGAVEDGTWTTPRGRELRVFRHGRVVA
jgi:RimJ/RimL family protein N-acetyltransferase